METFFILFSFVSRAWMQSIKEERADRIECLSA